MRALTLACLLLPLPALAETPMTGAEFERYATGKTLAFGADGVPYGMEQYLPGREVIWSYIGEECHRGTWFEIDEQICFTYEHDPTLQCWTFYDTADGLLARFQDGSPEGTELIEVDQSPEPLYCPGPEVGV